MLVAVADASPSLRAAVLATACQFGDVETLELLDGIFSESVAPPKAGGRIGIYQALVAEPSELSDYDIRLLGVLVAARLGLTERLRTAEFGSSNGVIHHHSGVVAGMILELCSKNGWGDVSRAFLDGVNSWRTKYLFRLAVYSRRHVDRATQDKLLDILLVRDDLPAKYLRAMVTLLAHCPRRQETFLAKRRRLEGPEADPGLSHLLVQWLDHDSEFLDALEVNDVEMVRAKLATYAPEHSSTLTTTRIKSVGEICSEMNWPYEEVIPSSAMTVYHPRFLSDRATVATETVVHPPIYRAELNNVVVHGGSWLILSGATGAYEPMQAPADDGRRFMHRDSTTLFSSGAYVLNRRARPERHVSAGIWMLCLAAHYVCSRALAYGDFGAFPPGTSILVDEAAIAIPQMAEILDLLNSKGLNVETIGSGEAVQVDRLFVAAPCAWSPNKLRKGKEPGLSDYIIHPQAVSALRRMAAPHLTPLHPGRRIFLSRRGARDPRLGNEAELATMAQAEFGFDLMDPARMTFAEQVRAFSEAEVIVGASGATMANLAFCSEGSKAYCLMSKRVEYSSWQSIAAATGCDVRHVLGQLMSLSSGHKRKLFTVDPEQLRTILHGSLGH
jgi:hypothetical protein